MSSPRAFPQNRVWCFGGFSVSSYDVKHSFLPMGSKLDSRQFGLMGRRESSFTYLARSSQLVDRAAARTARCSRQPVQLGRTSPTGQFSLTRCPLFLQGCPQFLVLLSCTYLDRMIGNARSSQHTWREACRASLPPSSVVPNHVRPSYIHSCRASAVSGRAHTFISYGIC